MTDWLLAIGGILGFTFVATLPMTLMFIGERIVDRHQP